MYGNFVVTIFFVSFSTYLRKMFLLYSKQSTDLQGKSIVGFLYNKSIGL